MRAEIVSTRVTLRGARGVKQLNRVIKHWFQACLSKFLIFNFYFVCRYSTGAATAVGTARKSLTVMLSLVIFPKPFHVNYAAG